MARLVKFCFLLACIMVISGCATNRGYLDIQVPSASLTDPNGKQVYIRSITDNRLFQDKPASADMPSIGFGGVKNATPEIKSRAIARKRNAYGRALGDILLDEGQSVEKVVYEATRNALYSLGYAVVDKQEQAAPDAIIVDVSIDKFWAWTITGMWAISLKSEITTANTVTVPALDKPIVIMAQAKNVCQVGNDANWRKVFRMVIDDFVEKAKTEFRTLEANP